MNSTRTAALLITGTVCAAVVTAAGTTVHAETPSSAYVARHAPQVDIEASAYASAAIATPNSLYGNSIRSLPAGYYVAPVGLGGPDTFSATDRPDGTTRVSNPSLSFAPSIRSGSTTDYSGQPTRVVGSALTPDASPATNLGLFSPTGAFLGLVGPGGLLIGDGVLPGQDGGLLIGNGADGAEGQDGGDGGIFYGNGGNGGHPGGFFGNGGDGGAGGNAYNGAILERGAAADANAGDGGNGGHGGLLIGNGGNGGNGGEASSASSNATAGDGGNGGNAATGAAGDGGHGAMAMSGAQGGTATGGDGGDGGNSSAGTAGDGGFGGWALNGGL